MNNKCAAVVTMRRLIEQNEKKLKNEAVIT
jgi:hypothetical protein